MKSTFTILTLISAFLTLSLNLEGKSAVTPNMEKDTIYTADCEDVSLLLDRNSTLDLESFVSEWVTDVDISDPNVIYNGDVEFQYDPNDICTGSLVEVATLDWTSGDYYIHEITVFNEPNISSLCGENMELTTEQLKEGISLSSLAPDVDGISLSVGDPHDSLLVDSDPELGRRNVGLVDNDNRAFCHFQVDVVEGPSCMDGFAFKLLEDTINMHVGINICTPLSIDDLDIEAVNDCESFELLFVVDQDSLGSTIHVPYTQNNPNRSHTYTIAMKTASGEIYTRKLTVIKTADPYPEPSLHVFSEDLYLEEGDILVIGVGGDLENLQFLQGKIGLPGAEVTDVFDVQPQLADANFSYNATDEDAFRFLFVKVPYIFSSVQGEPWFWMEIEATENGVLSDLLELTNQGSFNLLGFSQNECRIDIVFDYIFTLSQQLLFSSTDEVTPDKELTLYPNPVADRLYLGDNWQKIQSIQIFDMMGRAILSAEVTEAAMDLGHLNPGLYQIIATGENFRSKGSFVKK